MEHLRLFPTNIFRFKNAYSNVNEIKNIKIGNFTNPIVIPGGFLILKIKDKRKVEKKIDLEKEMNLIVKKKTNEQLNQFSNIYFNKIKKNVLINEL